MTSELLLAFILFAFVTSVTPGPNNMMLLASGVNFGIRRSLPHMLGISLGFMLLVAAVGLGLGQLFEQFPPLYTVLRYGGAAYLLYLAWKIAGSGAPDADGKATGKPFTFLQAAAFQWVNPKAWIMAIGAITTYTPQEGFLVNVLLIAALNAGLPSPPRATTTSSAPPSPSCDAPDPHGAVQVRANAAQAPASQRPLAHCSSTTQAPSMTTGVHTPPPQKRPVSHSNDAAQTPPAGVVATQTPASQRLR